MTTLVCSGRPVDDDWQPVGEPCGKTYKPLYRRDVGGWAFIRDETGATTHAVWRGEPQPPPPLSMDELVSEARSRGWAVGADGSVMCPDCRKPDPAWWRGLQPKAGKR